MPFSLPFLATFPKPMLSPQPSSALDQLRQFTVVVADTGEFHRLVALRPQDATTNPSLILKAIDTPEAQPLVQAAKAASTSPQARLEHLLVAFGLRILECIPGRVSTELDAALSFDTEACVAQARRLVAAYEAAGASRGRVLIKIAATWEGIRAAQRLAQEQIACNLTLIFGQAQARACAEAGVQLVSPFVGRISDWHKAAGQSWSRVDEDPGVAFVRSVHRAYKANGIATEVMGASFRSTDQVMGLAGCDLLTVSPALLESLAQQPSQPDFLPPLGPLAQGRHAEPEPWQGHLSEAAFRHAHNSDAMATEKLAEGIRLFERDGLALLGRLAQA